MPDKEKLKKECLFSTQFEEAGHDGWEGGVARKVLTVWTEK